MEFSIKADSIGQSAQMSWEPEQTPSWENTLGKMASLLYILKGLRNNARQSGSLVFAKNLLYTQHHTTTKSLALRSSRGFWHPSVIVEIKRLELSQLSLFCNHHPRLHSVMQPPRFSSQILWVRDSGTVGATLHGVWGFQIGICRHMSDTWARMAVGQARAPTLGLSMLLGLLTT